MSDRPAWAARSLVAGEGPALIAHGGGNSPGAARASFEAGADLVEVDVWAYGGRLETRHERRLPRSRVLFERWYLRWAPRRHSSLPELLAVARGRGGILLDLKNRRAVPRLVSEAIATAGGGVRVCASSQLWPVLRAVQAEAPGMEMFYSIDVDEQLELFLSVIERDRLPAGVSCNHRHLTPDLTSRLHDLGLAVIAWTVDEPERARELASMGVDAITTNRVAATRATLT